MEVDLRDENWKGVILARSLVQGSKYKTNEPALGSLFWGSRYRLPFVEMELEAEERHERG